MSTPEDYLVRTYAGVLGKIIGVYLGRPVEGWPVEDIERRFGTLRHYVNDQLGIPVVTADDDISGSFAFARAVVDHGRAGVPTARQVGETWLNYIIEDKTILWWGGRGRSTEHTAYLNLAAGVPAPESGSFARNGRTLPVQVGAQIFVDALAMMSPGDPERAAATARAAASVSHDGVAVEAAGFVAGMEALAYTERDLDIIVDTAVHQLSDATLLRIVEDVRSWCADTDDWRTVRDRIEHRYGYSVFDGPCPVPTNSAAVLAALLLGEDSFHRAVSVAASAGWDTDSNAGVVGALNGIRLGLAGLDAEADLRGPVADQLLVVTADGGECLTDALRETLAVDAGRRVLDGDAPAPRSPRFSFALPGSVQGFGRCEDASSPYVAVSVTNAGPGLRVTVRGVSAGADAAVSTPTFLARPGDGDNFSTLASPTLYPGQTIRARVRLEHERDDVEACLYVLAEDAHGDLVATVSPPVTLGTAGRDLGWTVPDVGPNPVLRVGLQVRTARRLDGDVVVEHVDWAGAPERYSQSGVLLTSIWDLEPESLRQWVSSAKNFEPDFRYTYSVSHPQGTGLATVGTRDWDDYTVSSTLVFNPHERGGIVARARGHRNYYAAVLDSWRTLTLVRRDHDEEHVLARADVEYAEDSPLDLALTCRGTQLSCTVGGRAVLVAEDDSSRALRSGGAGFLVTTGTMLADGFTVTAQEGRS
ncbi:ADP-ribosylglycohydrolase family protein [Georgenia subflava]|uniref:ADP-ribosylglycohydrolase family protein n=1 Tax=Georgenia subflava TaxID=1622177 RepID=A0A6N7EI20_9MICO|nr:ADP-ribosylglycohydrolase family protein [Georgenia subflava]MPV36275.1 ADP-ribosylglycohydrolase family protein [Georgenia subflava]